MLSSWLMKPTGYCSAALTTNNSVIARPAAIRTMCCFRGAAVLLGLQEEFHLDAGELDHVVILERVRRGADLLAVHLGPLVAFHVGDEVALRPARQHRDLDAGLAERGERLVELELLAGVAAGKQLDRAERLAAGLRRRSGGRGRSSGGRGGSRRGGGRLLRILVG